MLIQTSGTPFWRGFINAIDNDAGVPEKVRIANRNIVRRIFEGHETNIASLQDSIIKFFKAWRDFTWEDFDQNPAHLPDINIVRNALIDKFIAYVIAETQPVVTALNTLLQNTDNFDPRN